MNFKYIFNLLLVILVVSSFHPNSQSNGMKINAKENSPSGLKQLFAKVFNVDANGGGTSCAACTAITAIVEQLSQIHNKTADAVMDMLCSWLPSEFQIECDWLVAVYGETVVKMLENDETPDQICNQINVCTNSTCRLFPPPSSQSKRNYDIPSSSRGFERPSHLPTFVWPWDQVADHKPFVDIDEDLFSTMDTLRGYSWRGADCDDGNNLIYPGRRTTQYNADVDHNCNGIYGRSENGTSWEDLLCSGTPQYGTIILGDSAAAHFHVPLQWINASQMSEEGFSDMIYILENELDWPFMSGATGYSNSTWEGMPEGPVDSIYLRYRRRNRCMHRDYQNIAVNGARSSSMVKTIMETMQRNQTIDQPVLVTFSLIGNDVCNGHYGTSHMTTPDEFYYNIVQALKYLDEQLPSGSFVNLIGLVDGRILYDVMGDRIHPIGAYFNDVRYRDFYDFFNCLEISPCFGWMNSDPYWRNITTARAMELNQVYRDIVANHTFNNFELHYFDSPVKEVLSIWEAKGGQAWGIIEPVDGFHPNQIANALEAEVFWSILEQNNLLPPVNPFNDAIDSLFGDQGGYSE